MRNAVWTLVFAGLISAFVVGSISPVSAQVRSLPTTTPTIAPETEKEEAISARVHLLYNERFKSYEMILRWTDPMEHDGYAIAIARTLNIEPGEKVATTSAVWRLRTISPGTWYITLKPLAGEEWQESIYWKFEVPPLPSEITPTLTPQPTPAGEVKAVRSKIEDILKKLEKDKPAETPVTAREYTCDCSKNCRQVDSCSEAYFQMFSCGCVDLDSNKDGLPCENKCR